MKGGEGRRKEGRKAGSVKGKGNWKVIVIRILVTQVVPNTRKYGQAYAYSNDSKRGKHTPYIT